MQLTLQSCVVWSYIGQQNTQILSFIQLYKEQVLDNCQWVKKGWFNWFWHSLMTTFYNFWFECYYSPSKEVVRDLGSFHWPSLAISNISPLHILLACYTNKWFFACSQIKYAFRFEKWGVMGTKTTRFHFIWWLNRVVLARHTLWMWIERAEQPACRAILVARVNARGIKNRLKHWNLGR